MPLNHLSTTLYAALITTAVYGIAACLFAQSVMTMIRKRKLTGHTSWTLALPNTLIFLFASVNVLGLWVNLQYAFIEYPEGPVAFFALITTKPKDAIQTGQLGAIMSADLLMVYRTFIIWGNNFYVIIIPCMTFIATFVCGVVFVHLQHVDNATTSIFQTQITAWTISFLLCSFFTTVYSTGCIAFKMWMADRNMRGPNGVLLVRSVGRRVMRIFVESAMIYSMIHLLYAVLYAKQSNVEATPSFLEASVASLACSMIIIRCESVVARTDSTTNSSRPSDRLPHSPVALNVYPNPGAHLGTLKFGKETLIGSDMDLSMDDIHHRSSSPAFAQFSPV